jgi:hypothetical protein
MMCVRGPNKIYIIHPSIDVFAKIYIIIEIKGINMAFMVVNSTRSFDTIYFEVYDLKDKINRIKCNIWFFSIVGFKPRGYLYLFLENKICGLVGIMTFKN